jgi:hypothetical protein
VWGLLFGGCMEMWKSICGIDVSNYGNIRSKKYPKGDFKGNIDRYGYFVFSVVRDGIYKCVGVHRLVYCAFNNVNINSKFVTDHINGIRTDNRIENLRSATWRLNSQNRYDVRNGSKLLGVSYNKKSDNYRASIHIDGKGYKLGSFDSEKLAHDAYLVALDRYNKFGEIPKTTIKNYSFYRGSNVWVVRINNKVIGRYKTEKEAIESVNIQRLILSRTV